MAKLSEIIQPGQSCFTQLGSRVLAVLVRRVDGWCVYVGGVPGHNHSLEWLDVRDHGDKVKEPVARAIIENYFYPAVEADLPYAL